MVKKAKLAAPRALVMSKLESIPSRTLWMELLALLSVNNTRT
jgi:hypothetical protein